MLICLVLILAILLGAPQTSLGRALRGVLVERPAAFLSRIRPLNLIAFLAIAGVTAWLVIALQGDGARLALMSLPEAVAWLAAFDLTAFVEVFGAVFLVAATARLKVVGLMAARLAAFVRRPRAPRAIRARRAKPPAGDDEHPAFPAWALAA